jgi:transaldolase
VTKLHDLYETCGQSPWLDNLRRGWITSGELSRWVERGVRGITSNPSIFAKAIEGAHDYDDQFRTLVAGGTTIEDSYWNMVTDDIGEALRLLRPVYDESGGRDGFVSVEVSPALARDTNATIDEAHQLWDRIDKPNLFVKIPGTAEGLPAIRACLADGININITLLFSIRRYGEVIDAWFDAIEARVAANKPIDALASVASFFVSRVDTEVDRRLDAIGTPAAVALQGKAAVANAQLAYELFLQRFSGERWETLERAGATVQRPLWASTSVKDPRYPDTLYIDSLIGPDTVNTMPEQTLQDFEDHGKLGRTIDADFDGARRVIDKLAEVGVDLDDVTRVLEEEGVAAFTKSYDELLASLESKAGELRP